MGANKLIWAAVVVTIAAFQLWPYLPEGSFFVGQAIFILIAAYIIFSQNSKLFASFFLLCLALNNLLDELFFDPKINGLNEIIIVLILPIVWLLKIKRMPDKILNSEFYIFLTKIIFPAFLAVGIKIAIEMKKTKSRVSFLNIALSMLIGVGGAWLSSDTVLANCGPAKVPIVIALIAITSEKIGDFVIYKLNVDGFLTAVVDGFFEYLINIFKARK